MSLAEAIRDSNLRMSDDEEGEFKARVLVEDEEIEAAFWLESNLRILDSIVFTSNRLVLETRRSKADSNGTIKPFSSNLTSIPYGQISMYTLRKEGPSSAEVLSIWVPGYYNEAGLDGERRTINVSGGGKLDLNLLYKILSSQIAKIKGH